MSDVKKCFLQNVQKCSAVFWKLVRFCFPFQSSGNFNGAVEILLGLKSEKLRSFWLSLKPNDKKKYGQVICFENIVLIDLFFFPFHPGKFARTDS